MGSPKVWMQCKIDVDLSCCEEINIGADRRTTRKMCSTLMLSVIATFVFAQATFVPPVKATYSHPTPEPSGYGYDKPEVEIQTITLTEQTIVTTSQYVTATHQVFVTNTRDAPRIETLNTARLFTAEVTIHQVQPSAPPRTTTAVVKSTTQSLVVRTIREPQ